MSIIFSGIQPTGALHIGNYLGAIKQWKEMIVKNPNALYIFSIVDLHSITIKQDPEELSNNILQTFATYLACDIITSDNIIIFKHALQMYDPRACMHNIMYN